MKFRMFTDLASGRKIAVNIDSVDKIVEVRDGCEIWIGFDSYVTVAENYDVVFSRLNTIAE